MKQSRGKGIGGHTKPNNGEEELWLTPPQVLSLLGSFDLDPCACPEPRPWATARHHIALPEDGLSAAWAGRIWMNPPYGDKAAAWLEKMARHRSGIALIFARTETETWTQSIWANADAVLFVRGRLTFYRPDGTAARSNSGGPSALISYSPQDTEILANSGIAGALVRQVELVPVRARRG